MHKLYTIFVLLIPLITFGQSKDAIKEYNAGLEYYNLRNYVDAIPFFENAVKKDPSFVNAYRVLISCHELQNNTEKVAELYEKTIELSP